MASSPSATLAIWSRRAAWTGLLLAVLLPLAVFVADRTWGEDVLLIHPHDSSVVALNRSTWLAGDPVAELYGSPMSTSTRVLLTDRAAVTHPAEQPDLSLLPVSGGTTRPLQIKTLHWASRLGQFTFGGAAAALFVLSALLRRRAGALASAAAR